MSAIILFIGITAVVGTAGYFAARPLVLEHWHRWRADRAQTRERQQRAQRRQALHDEATTSALRQLAQREEAMRSVGRKAA